MSHAIRRAPQTMSPPRLLLEWLQDVVRGIDDVSQQLSGAINEGEDGESAPAEEEGEGDASLLPSGSEALCLAPSFAARR